LLNVRRPFASEVTGASGFPALYMSALSGGYRLADAFSIALAIPNTVVGENSPEVISLNHKPMLAVDCGGVDSLSFPLIASPKLDGVRAIISADGVLSRTLKLIPNKKVQALLKGIPVGLDGELLAGDPCAPDVYRKTVSMVMSEDAAIDGLKYHVFDIQRPYTFGARYLELCNFVRSCPELMRDDCEIVPQHTVTDVKNLLALESEWVSLGYEGAILRKPDGPYKHGRSTRKEGYLLKLKRFSDSEAEVLGVVELMHNGNEAKTNALGHTERSSHKAGKVGMGVLGALQVRDCKTGVEFEIGTGFTAAERAAYWTLGVASVIGRLAKYKYFAGGSKDKPRFPVFLGWRNQIDT
jgi:DNA ligase 1